MKVPRPKRQSNPSCLFASPNASARTFIDSNQHNSQDSSEIIWVAGSEDKLTLDPHRADAFYTALLAAGMPHVPDEFSVVPQDQIIPASIVAESSDFIRVFDRVTGRAPSRRRPCATRLPLRS